MSLPSEYEKQRDEAAYKHFQEYKDYVIEPYRSIEPPFRDFCYGADWAQARAEKRIQELKEKLKAIIANYKNLADYSRGKSKTIEMLLKRLNSKQEKLQGLEDHIDLMVDEFKRISVEAKSLPVSLPSIYGESIIQLCERAVSNTKQHIPVIVQRDRAEEKIQSLEQKLTNQEQLNQKLAEGNSVLYKQKMELEKQAKLLSERDQRIDELKERLEIKTKVEFDKAMKVQRLEATQETLVNAINDAIGAVNHHISASHGNNFGSLRRALDILAQATKGEKGDE